MKKNRSAKSLKRHKEQKPTISACMIVKNEEENLPRCLESIKNVVDEIIIVDTGSTDKTVEIAKSFGAKVFHHPWENDFSKHRNQSISYANGEWILIIDADEELSREVSSDLRRVVRKASKNGVDYLYVTVRNCKLSGEVVSEMFSVRVFKNSPKFRYTNIVHNELSLTGNGQVSDLIINHYGYSLSDEKMEKKSERTITLLKRWIERSPTDPKPTFYLAKSYGMAKQHTLAIQYSLETKIKLDQIQSYPLYYHEIYYILAVSFYRIGLLNMVTGSCMEGLKRLPNYLDLYYLLFLVHKDMQETDQSLKWAQAYMKCLKKIKKDPTILESLAVYTRSKDAIVKKFIKEFQGRERKASASLPRNSGKPHFDSTDTTTREITLSACMIVKNEEENLPRCLESIKNVVDEIIIVDTGSTDKTVEIAKSFGAKVYHHPWENDFGKHRNQSISYATGDWVFIIDADERLKKESHKIIRKAISEPNADSILITVINLMNQGKSESWVNQIRLFRNEPEIRYNNIVHNRLVGYKSPLYYPIYIYHYGYDLTENQWKAKFRRTATLLVQQIEKEPDIYRHRHDLAACYLSVHDYEKAIEEGKKAIQIASETSRSRDVLLLWTHFIVGFSYLKLQDFDNAIKYSLDALNNFKDHLDSFFVLSCAYHEKQDWVKCRSACTRYLEILEIVKKNPAAFGDMILNTVKEEWRIYMALGDCELEDRQGQKAKELFSKAIDLSPDEAECLKMIGDFLASRGMWQEAKECYNKAVASRPDYTDAHISLAITYKNLQESKAYNETMLKLKDLPIASFDQLNELGTLELMAGHYESASLFLEKALASNYSDPSTHANLAVAYKYMGKIEDAINHNKKALEISPYFTEALANLGHLYFESGRNDLAIEQYEKLRELNPELLDVNLRVCILYILDGDFDSAVDPLNRVLNTLQIPTERTLDSLLDLIRLFLEIAHKLELLNKRKLAREVHSLAELLRDNLPNEVNNQSVNEH